VGQPQAPFKHMTPVAQDIVHEPQWLDVFSATQAPPQQPCPAAQQLAPQVSCPVAQAALQAVPAPLQPVEGHAEVAGAGQAPLPSQLAAGVAVPFVQLAARHVVVAAGKAHDVRLVPSHAPPHVAPAPAQAAWPVDVRGAPLTAVQVPLVVASAQASHCPAQAVLQQTPSAQNPLRHAVPVVHA
jgi:hypothetical protein